MPPGRRADSGHPTPHHRCSRENPLQQNQSPEGHVNSARIRYPARLSNSEHVRGVSVDRSCFGARDPRMDGPIGPCCRAQDQSMNERPWSPPSALDPSASPKALALKHVPISARCNACRCRFAGTPELRRADSHGSIQIPLLMRKHGQSRSTVAKQMSSSSVVHPTIPICLGRVHPPTRESNRCPLAFRALAKIRVNRQHHCRPRLRA